MDFLLKIVDGPMKGAEIALVGGTSVSFGSGDDCDIVLADPELAPKAATFEVTDEGVTVHAADGSAVPLDPFTVKRFGATAIAVGPATGRWEKLKEPAPETSAPAAAPEAPTPAPAKRERSGIGCFAVLLILILLVGIAAAALWFFRAPLAERYPKAAETVNACVLDARQYAMKAFGWTEEKFRTPPPPPAPPLPTLDEIAADHRLVYTNGVIRGNLARRTERLAIRALALAVNPSVKFDLTDDESFARAAHELLFACSEGRLAVLSISNRTVKIGGYAPNARSLAASLRALNTDVKGVEGVDVTCVRVGGKPPAVPLAVRQSVEPAVLQEAADEAPVAAAAPSAPSVKARPDYPIAGILTVPYPCVVMRNGLRLVEGAQVGTATLVKIEANRLTLKEGNTEFKWEP